MKFIIFIILALSLSLFFTVGCDFPSSTTIPEEDGTFSPDPVDDKTTSESDAEDSSVDFDYGTFIDVEGNEYRTIIIGNLEWMVDNLRTASYADGSPIQTGLSDDDWANATIGAYAIYPYEDAAGIDTEQEMVKTFGLLYNWHALDGLTSGEWRVPTDEDWKNLEGFADTQYDSDDLVWDEEGFRGHDAANNLKYDQWWPTREGGVNSLGFGALPGGIRALNGVFVQWGSHGSFWTDTEEGVAFDGDAWSRTFYVHDGVSRNQDPQVSGYSVRLVRDIG